MNYAVDYADVGETRIARWQNSEEPTAVILEDFDAKIEFLRSIAPNDTIWMELGGAGDVLAELLMKVVGANVRRVGPHLVKVLRDAIYPVRRGRSKKERMTNDHLIIAQLAQEKPDSFYLVRVTDLPIVRLSVAVAGRYSVQKTVRIPTQLRLTRILRDQWMLDNASAIMDAPLKELETALKSDLKKGIWENPIFQGAEDYEDELTDQIKKLLKDIPLYETVFEPIHGCGPVIGGTVIAAIQDIRRYRSLAALTAYAGYHVVNVDGRDVAPNHKWAKATRYQPTGTTSSNRPSGTSATLPTARRKTRPGKVGSLSASHTSARNIQSRSKPMDGVFSLTATSTTALFALWVRSSSAMSGRNGEGSKACPETG